MQEISLHAKGALPAIKGLTKNQIKEEMVLSLETENPELRNLYKETLVIFTNLLPKAFILLKFIINYTPPKTYAPCLVKYPQIYFFT